MHGFVSAQKTIKNLTLVIRVYDASVVDNASLFMFVHVKPVVGIIV